MRDPARWSYALHLLLISAATARIYDRCELARELSFLGIDGDTVPTWVCIAYHESRYDTSAYNPSSGDHGILQISQLYWCGPGKACGIPCEQLRDDNITDDVFCARRIHEEHSRLQGDGFMAWVVYPIHCKRNTKKYLTGCDASKFKSVAGQHSIDNNYYNVTSSSVEYRHTEYAAHRQSSTYTLNPKIDKLLPPYLFAGWRNKFGNLKNVTQQSKKKGDSWPRNLLQNIDSLKLPVFKKRTENFMNNSNISYSWRRNKPFTNSINNADKKPIEPVSFVNNIRIVNNLEYLHSNRLNYRKNNNEIIKNEIVESVANKNITHNFNKSKEPIYQTKSVTKKNIFKSYNTKNLLSILNTSTVSPISRSVVTNYNFSKGKSKLIDKTKFLTSTDHPVQTTQSIFDFYLNRSRQKPSRYNFTYKSDSKYKIKVFSEGTTKPVFLG